MVRIEYKEIITRYGPIQLNELNKLGMDRWRLAHIYKLDISTRYIFEREYCPQKEDKLPE